LAWRQTPFRPAETIDLVENGSALEKVAAIIEHQHRDTYERIVSPNHGRVLEYEDLIEFKRPFEDVQAHRHATNLRR
jgi:hypothetical protein